MSAKLVPNLRGCFSLSQLKLEELEKLHCVYSLVVVIIDVIIAADVVSLPLWPNISPLFYNSRRTEPTLHVKY